MSDQRLFQTNMPIVRRALATPAALVYNSGAVAVANGVNTAVTFSAARRDDIGFWSAGSPTRLTFPKPCSAVVGCCIEWASGAGNRRSFSLLLNGATYLASETVPPAGGGQVTQQVIERLYEFAAGDYVQFIAGQDSGGSLNINASSTYSPEAWVWILP